MNDRLVNFLGKIFVTLFVSALGYFFISRFLLMPSLLDLNLLTKFLLMIFLLLVFFRMKIFFYKQILASNALYSRNFFQENFRLLYRFFRKMPSYLIHEKNLFFIAISNYSKVFNQNTAFRRFTTYLLIPAFLLFLGIALFLNNVLSYDEAFSVLTQRQDKSVIFFGKLGEILTGEKITGKFKAKEDNLGIVSLRFNTFGRINNDILIFRIKEEWDEKWYYENEYKVDQFQQYGFFPFGFPIIQDSKDRRYSLEIESTNGKTKNAVSISEYSPIFEAKYKFSRDEILSSKKELITFLYKKVLNSFTDKNNIFISIIFFFPLAFYFFWLFLTTKFYNQAYFLLFFVILSMLIDTFFIYASTFIVTLILVPPFLISIRFYNMGRDKAIKLSIILFFLLLSLSILFNKENIAAKSGLWIYFLILTLIIQRFFPKNQKNK